MEVVMEEHILKIDLVLQFFRQSPCGVLSAFLVGYFQRFNYENAHFPVSWRMCQIREPKSHISSATSKVSKLFGHLIDQNPCWSFWHSLWGTLLSLPTGTPIFPILDISIIIIFIHHY